MFCYEGSCGKNAGAGLLDEDERHMAVGCFIQWWLMLSKYASTEVFVVGCKWVSWNIFHCLCDDEASGIWPVCGWNWCAIATQCTQGAKFSTKNTCSFPLIFREE